MPADSFDVEAFPDLLPIYYQRLFPFSYYYKWLNYGNKNLFPNREFSFTLKDDVYIRYQSFKDDAEMKKQVLEKIPYKMDIGAVYSMKPREHRMVSSFHPVEKELVFDIDMTDYDDVRTCCSGADICEKCWMFMTAALKILNRALTEDFGFKHLLWVYSGRRGIHCWVCDEEARKLSPRGRSAIVEYLSLVKGGEYKSKKVHLSEVLHPSIEEASKIIEKYFPTLMLQNQKILESEKGCQKVIRMCQDENVQKLIRSALSEQKSSVEKWESLKQIDDIAPNNQKGKIKNWHFPLEVMFEMCYPRLDVNVSKGLNHLLKAPFCVHPKTGRVCVPIDPKNADSFDPMKVPTVSQICDEINAFDAKLQEEGRDENYVTQMKKLDDVMKTSLKKGVWIFQTFVDKLCDAS